LATFFFIAALFVAWRCLAVGVAKPVSLIVLVLTAALLSGIGWLVRLITTGRRPRPALLRIASVVGRASAIPAECGEPTEPADDVLQQLTRRTTPDGSEELSGWLRMNLTAGQRSGTLHVAFCPPFDRPPEVQVEMVSGPDCRIKAADALPYGVRLEIKLNVAAAANESVLLWFFAANESRQSQP
jgi:hypothetical protein